MKLTFIYQPVDDLTASVNFHRDVLGFEEAWREGDDTVSFWLPGRSAQLMLSTDPKPSGPMYLVDSLESWMRDNAQYTVVISPYAIPNGSVAGFEAPGGGVFYVFDQPGA